jgi:hypothetical protein
MSSLNLTLGSYSRAIAQAVSRRLPTAAARVQTRVGMWDFVMDKSSAGAGFLRELRFPLPIYIPSCSPQSSSLSPEAGTIGRSGRSAYSVIVQIKKKHWDHGFESHSRRTFMSESFLGLCCPTLLVGLHNVFNFSR